MRYKAYLFSCKDKDSRFCFFGGEPLISSSEVLSSDLIESFVFSLWECSTGWSTGSTFMRTGKICAESFKVATGTVSNRSDLIMLERWNNNPLTKKQQSVSERSW